MIIAGAGFAGLQTAKALSGAAVDLIVLDRQNHQCFQPLLYQVATATLTPADIAWPIRSMLAGQTNTHVYMAEVQGVDVSGRQVLTNHGRLHYDVLVVATGATHAYFGHDEWARYAPGLKRLEDATEIRRRLLTAFEEAEFAPTETERRALMTFVVVGGGPTGVEMAGAIKDMADQALAPDFRNIAPKNARVVLIEAGPRLLPSFPGRLSAYAERALRRRGVEVELGRPVTEIGPRSVTRKGGEVIEAGAVVWAAGVAASAAGDWLGADKDRAGRVKVGPSLNLPGHPEVYVIGDTASSLSWNGDPAPGIAPAAKQMGQFVAERIRALAEGRRPSGAFHYRHQGDLATVGRNAAIVHIGSWNLTGLVGWLFWSLIHIYFLIGVRNRIAVAFSWLWDYLTFGRRSRLITYPPPASALARATAGEPAARPEPLRGGAWS